MAYSSFVTNIAEATVTYGQIQNLSSNNLLLGRYDVGPGPMQEITIGSGLSLTGNILRATPASITTFPWVNITGTPTTLLGYGITDAATLPINWSDVTATPTNLSGYGITDAIQNSLPSNDLLLGRSTAGSGVVEQITVGSGLSLASGILSALGSGTEKIITQSAHGFVVENVLEFNGTNYVLAKADSAADTEVIGMVSSVIDANTFVLHSEGWTDGLSGKTPGTTYFLSDVTAGALVDTEPVTVGSVSKPLFVADSATSGYFFNWRGIVVPAPQLAAGGTTGQVQYNDSSVLGGITGATTDGTTMNLTNPKISGTGISDTNGVTILGLTPVTSATNYLDLGNSTGAPIVTMTGASSNIGLQITTKGTSGVRLTNNGMNVGAATAATDYFNINLTNDGNIRARNAALFMWSSSAVNSQATIDTAIGRNAAGVLEVNTGTLGTLGGLKASVVNATTGFEVNGAAASGTILKGNGTNFVPSTETYASPGTTGNVLTSDGTNWISAAPTGGGGGSGTFIGLTDVPAAFTGAGTDYVRVNAGETALEFRSPAQVLSDIGAQASGSYVPTTRTLTINGTALDLSANRAWTVGDALVANPLSQFAATTSAQLAGVINDETGSGLLVFATSPSLTTPLLGTPTSGNLANCTFPTLNQDTTGSAVYWKTSGTGKGAITGPATGTTRTYTFPDADSTILYSGGALGTPSSGTATNLSGTAASLNIGGSAASLSVSGQTGLLTVTGLTSTNRAKTVRDAADTLLELGGSYTPSGTWTNMTLVTPALGTPTALVGTNITGTASGLTAGNVTTNANLTGPITSVGNATSFAAGYRSRTFVLENPTASENVPFFFTTNALTISKVHAVLVGSSTPSVTYNIGYGTDVTSLTNVTTSPSALTSTTTGTDATLNNTSVPASGFLVFKTTAQSGTVNSIMVTVEF